VSCQSSYIVGRFNDIDRLIVDVTKWSANDPELAAHLAAYVSVLVVGILEDCIENLVATRANKANDPEIFNYIIKIIGQRFRNPDYSKISQMLLDFSPAYQSTFKSMIAPNGREADALQSLVDNKNSLAHTGTVKLNLTIGDVQIYYNYSMRIIQTLEQILS
jgi:hypothetical protein